MPEYNVMTKNRHTVDALFAQARAELPVVSFNETCAHVAGYEPDARNQLSKSHRKKHIIMTTLIIGTVVAALLGILSLNSDDKPVAGAYDGLILQSIGSERTTTKNERGETAHNEALQVKSVQGEPGEISGEKDEPVKGHHGGDQGKKKHNTDDLYRSPAPFITGIGTIELDQNELWRLGLKRDTAGVWLYRRAEGTVASLLTSMYGTIYNIDAEDDVPRSDLLPSFLPVFITDDYGNRRTEVFDKKAQQTRDQIIEKRLQELEEQTTRELSNIELMKAIAEMQTELSEQRLTTGNFVPVIVRTGREYTAQDKADRRWRPDCIFWYEPTEEFLAALPERIRRSLQRELYVVSVLQNKPERQRMDEFMERQPSSSRELYDSLVSKQGIDEGKTIVAGDSYLDSWRAASGAITSSSVLPNPAHEKLYVTYHLSTQRQVTLGLYDVNGQLVRTLSELQSRSGENLEILDLKGVSPGMYLLAIATDNGERAVQRVIVE